MEPITLLTVVGTALGILLLILKNRFDSEARKKKEQDELSNQIDSATNADDIMHISGKLRDKK